MAAMPCVIVRKGAPEAGTIYICIRVNNQHNWLMGPPVGPTLNEDGDRVFVEVFSEAVAQEEIDAYLARQAGYDPDIWIVEVEDREGKAFLRE